MADNNKPYVELFLRAAPNRTKSGGCLISQQWHMTFNCLVEKGLIEMQATPTTMVEPDKNYMQLNVARHLPVACIKSGILDGEDATGLTICSTESLETLLIKLKCPNLNPDLQASDVRAAEKVTENLYRNFMQYIKNDDLKPLYSVLSNLDSYLASAANPYAMGDKISYVDCELAPKLQHVRVAGRFYKNFDIPCEMKHIWIYMQNIYKVESFINSCPTSRDILEHYKEKIPVPNETSLVHMGSDRLLDIPRDVLPSLNGDH